MHGGTERRRSAENRKKLLQRFRKNFTLLFAGVVVYCLKHLLRKNRAAGENRKQGKAAKSRVGTYRRRALCRGDMGMKRVRTEEEQPPREYSFSYRIATVLFPLAALLLAAVFVLCGIAYGRVRPYVTIELGEQSPRASTFAAGDANAAYRTQPEAYYKTPGSYRLWMQTGAMTVPVLLRVVDTNAPTAEAQELTIPLGTTVTPEKLVRKIRDESIVKVTFAEPVGFDRIGDFNVEIVLEDLSGNRSTVGSVLHIRAVRDELLLEAGSPAPGADAFLLEGVTAVPQSLPTADMMHHVGVYPMQFLIQNGQTAESQLIVADTEPPTGERTSLWLRPDDPLTPDMLVLNPQDETDITFSYEIGPDDSHMQVQRITVRMTDEGGNTTDVESELVVSRIEPIAVEASDTPLTAEMLSHGEEVVLEEPFVANEVGIYSVPLQVDGAEDFVLITVRDTTPPTVEKDADVTLYTMHPVEADAVFSAQDYSPVTLTWVTEPDWTKPGEQQVRVRAEDASGNAVEIDDTVVLAEDTKPPELYGVMNRTAYVGEPIAYLAEVYAEDAVDGLVQVTVDSEVKMERAGTYKVTFTAVDISGNRATATCKYKLVKPSVSEEEVRELAQNVLREIITKDMVTAEKLKAVFDYTRGHVRYVGNSDKSDWRKEAVRGFKTGKGDCFTFYSVTRALLDELGVEYMSVQRQGGRTRHYWTIVNIGTGWYHFDTTFTSSHRAKCFMWTNEQCKVKPYFWRYDHSKYPDIATTKFDYDEVVRLEKEGKLP